MIASQMTDAEKAHLLPAFGALPVESVTTEVIEQWRDTFGN